MSTPNEPTPDEPRFGARSDHWNPESPSSSDQTPPAPWPQYGQNTSGQGTPQWPQAGASGAPDAPRAPSQPPYGQYGQQARPGQGAPQGQPGGPAQFPPQGGYPQHPYAATGPAGPAYGAPRPELPSRAWPIVLIVAGIVVAMILSVVTLVGVAASGINWQKIVDSANPVASGSTVTVDDSGSYIVTATDGTKIACTLTSGNGTVLELQAPTGQSNVVMGSKITPGQYRLDCTGVTSSTSLVGMTGFSTGDMASLGARAVMWATVVGLIGLAMTIGGIVWLVRVNGRRREVQRNAWRGGAYSG